MPFNAALRRYLYRCVTEGIWGETVLALSLPFYGKFSKDPWQYF